MKIRNLEHGYYVEKRVRLAVTNPGGTAGGSQIVVPFDELAEDHNGMPVVVLALRVVMPTASLTIPINKAVDGASMAQFLGTNLRLSLASDAPPVGFDGDRQQLINGVDGYRALEVLHLLSGVPVIVGAGGDFLALEDTTMNATTMAAAKGVRASQRREGLLATQGPFGAADGVAAAWSDRPEFIIPFAIRDGEEHSATGIPAGWFTGKVKGARAGTPGELAFTLPTTVDGIAVTYSGTVDVYAICLVLPRSKTSAPPTLHLTAYQQASNTLRGKRGLRGFLAFMKPLTSNGAMQAHDYTDINVSIDGSILFDSKVSVHRDLLSLLLRPGSRPTHAETSLSHANQSRYARSFVGLIVPSRESVFRTAGSVDSETEVVVVTTGESTHYVVDATYTPVVPAFAKRAEEWAPLAGGMAVPSARDAQAIDDPRAVALPHKVIARPPGR